MVGEYIRSLRAAAGMKQRDLAERVGISPSMLSLIEAGKREPTVRMLREIGRALEIPAAALFVVALEEEHSDSSASKDAQKLQAMSASLLSAVQHSLVLRRLQRVREQD